MTSPPRPARPSGPSTLTRALWPLLTVPAVLAGLVACSAAPPAAPPAALPALRHAAVPAPLPAADPASVPWRDAHALVERLKGHAGHLREAPASGTPASAPDQAVPRRPDPTAPESR